MKKYQHLLFFFWLSPMIAGCLPRPGVAPAQAWDYTDLQVLAPASASSPSLDLIALYTRLAGGDLQIRLDLLDMSLEPDSDLYLALDTGPGGTSALPLDGTAGLEWDTLIVIPASGTPQALTPGMTKAPSPPASRLPLSELQPHPDLIPRVVRNPWLDTVVVSLNRAALPAMGLGFRLQVFITPPGMSAPADSLGPLRSDSPPPVRAPVLLAFWNTFPAYTPAQALRRWDGAHTGPFGGRHGLRVLLQAVRRARVPVALLDLKTPAALSALDSVGGLPLVQSLYKEGLLILPDPLPGSPSLAPSQASFPEWAVARAVKDSRQAALDFGLAGSQLLYSPTPDLIRSSGENPFPADSRPLSSYRTILTPLDGLTTGPGRTGEFVSEPLRWQEHLLVPLPAASSDPQATAEGLSLETRRALLAQALSAPDQDPDLSVLGGDLSQSAWGDPRSAEASLAYIAAHPWLQPLAGPDLRPGFHQARQASKNLIPVAPGYPRTSNFRVQRSPNAAIGSHSPPRTLFEPLPLFSLPSATGQASISSAVASLLPLVLHSSAHENPASLAAWQAYLALFSPLPPEPASLPFLRSGYTGPVGVLLEAARWAANPGQHSDCHADPDLDGQANCILASNKYFSIFDSDGGRLIAFFAFSPETGLHQIVAPTSQFIVGLGDPSSWTPEAGPGGEPAGIHGAFADSKPPWPAYFAAPELDRLTFAGPDNRVAKIFTLTDQGLRVDYLAAGPPLTLQIPLALDPWARFTPGWASRYQSNPMDGGWSWQLTGGPRVEVRSSGDVRLTAFTDSLPQMKQAEDPNFPYPPGHYLPFPMAVAEVRASRDFFVEILVSFE